VIWSDASFIAFLVLKPIAPGHVVVIPRHHVKSIYDLDQHAYAALFERVRIVAEMVRRAEQPAQVGVAVEGLSVPHAHVHVLPVNQPGDLDPCRAQPTTTESRRAMGERLRSFAPAV
jgi:histidine triad (HIT) family protein